MTRTLTTNFRSSLLIAAMVLPLQGACSPASLTECADSGRICPDGYECAAAQDMCVPSKGCGNGVIDDGEVCDDGNVLPGDGCPPDCSACGNGVVEDFEVCDGEPPAGDSCVQHGFDLGKLECSSDCSSIVTDDCQYFAWTRMDTPEDAFFGRLWSMGPDNVLIAGGAAGAVSGELEALIACGFSPDCGRVYHYDGDRWQEIATGTGLVVDIWASDEGDAFAVGPAGIIIRSRGGAAWSRMDTPGDYPFISVWGTSIQNLFVGTIYGDIFHWDGTAWSRMAIPFERFYLRDIDGADSSNVYAVGKDGKSLFYDGNREGLWRAMTTNTDIRINSVLAADTRNIIAVGERGTILHHDGTEDLQWRVVRAGTVEDPEHTAIFAASADDLVITGYRASVLHYNSRTDELISDPDWQFDTIITGIWSDESGYLRFSGFDSIWHHHSRSGWTHDETGENRRIYALSVESPASILAAGDNGLLMHYDGAWNAFDIDLDYRIYDTWIDGNGNAFAVGEYGTILYYQDDTGWIFMNSGVTQRLSGIWGSASTDVFTVGENGTILHYDGNDRLQWTAMVSSTTKHLRGIAGSTADHIFAVGDDFEVVHYDGNANGTWSSVWSESMRSALRPDGVHRAWDLWVDASGNAFIAGDFGRVLLHERDSNNWYWSSTGIQISWYAVWGRALDDVYVAGNDGIIAHYNGDFWSELRGTGRDEIEAISGIPGSDTVLFGNRAGEVHRLTLPAGYEREPSAPGAQPWVRRQGSSVRSRHPRRAAPWSIDELFGHHESAARGTGQ